MGAQAGTDELLTFSDEKEVGGQTFNKFPEDPAEVAEFWSNVWFEVVQDMAPPLILPPTVSQATWKTTMEALVQVPGGGIAALDAAANAAFLTLAAAMAPNVIVAAPPPFISVLAGVLAPFIAGTTDPVAPAVAFGIAFVAWLAQGTWSVPGPPVPVPVPFVVKP